jgi:hypothetical protein
MKPVMDDIAKLAASLGKTVAFPGRLRVFGGRGLAGVHLTDWPDSDDGTALAAACGAAWAEAGRGGRVLVVVGPEALAEELGRDAAALAVRLGLGNLVAALVDGGADGGEAVALGLTAAGWERLAKGRNKRTGPVFTVLSASTKAKPQSQDKPPLRREWQPVNLPTLPRGGLPPWPIDDAVPAHAATGDWLAWLAQREPRLLVADAAAPWRDQPDDEAKLLALAHLASEGRRVCWRLPPGTDLSRWLPRLGDLGRRGLALKLLCAAADLPGAQRWADQQGWWVMAPAEAREAAVVLAQTLDNEDGAVIGLPTEINRRIPAFGADQAYCPGSARVLAEGAALTLVSDHRTAGAALAARARLHAAGIEAGVLHCTSLSPLPAPALEAAAARGPLIVADDGGGLGLAVATAVTEVPCPRVIAVGVEELDSAALVERVRKLLAAGWGDGGGQRKPG